jgi:hypothetical protein
MASLLAVPKETFMKHRKTLWKSSVLILCLCAGYMLQHGQLSFQPRKADASVVPAGEPAVSFAKLPLSFEANQGQTDARVKFLSRGPGYTLFLTGDEVALELQDSGSRIQDSVRAKRSGTLSALRRTTDYGQRTRESLLRLKLVNANQSAVATGTSELPGKVNYFIGNDPRKWRTNVPTYAKVKYEGVYPGVDLVFYGNQRQLEHDFVVAPGADPGQIALQFEGSQKASLDAEGNLNIAVGRGEVHLQKPLIYQDGSGGRREVAGGYVLKSSREIAFKVGDHDPAIPLVIDPVLAYSTYLGGSNSLGNNSNSMTVDSSGNAYVTGAVWADNFPTTAGAFQTTLAAPAGNANAYVTKLNPSGSALVYSTYLGGSYDDAGFGIAVDSSGNVYVTGSASSSDFPTTPGAFQTTLAGTYNAFVTKLNASGTGLIYSTYLGGGWDGALGIVVDSSGNAYVTGDTGSSSFPTTAGAFQTSLAGYENGFVSKLNPSGSGLVYSTYMGGSYIDEFYGVAVDSTGHACLSGTTLSSDFPRTAGAFQTELKGSQSAFVAKLNPAGSGLVYSTYLGGSNYEEGFYIALNSSGNAYVTGETWSADFPTTPGAFQTTFGGGGSNGFISELNSNGTGLVYSTYLSASGGVMGAYIGVDSSGNASVAGTAWASNLPTTPGAYQTTLRGTDNAFVWTLNPSGSALLYASYLGGSGQDTGGGLGVDPLGNVYVSGITTSANFPTTAGAFQGALAGSQNAFVAKFESTSQAQVTNLQSTVKNLVSTGTLNAGLGQFLLAPLNAALTAVNAGRTAIAVLNLDAFIIDVRLMTVLRRVTPTEGQTLINAANSLIAALRG